jgi:ZIP family zinc transporter
MATGLGAIPVFLLGARAERLQPVLSAVAAIVMVVASLGLLAPAFDDGSTAAVIGGIVVGACFVLAARRRLRRRGRFAGAERAAARRSLLVFGVLFVHSFPEGFAVGAAWAAHAAALGPFVVIAIALQNIPEGTAVAIPMANAGYSASRQFWAAVGTSAPQPLGALIAYVLVEEVRALLPVSLAFAAGAMLAVVFWELAPELLRPRTRAQSTR